MDGDLPAVDDPIRGIGNAHHRGDSVFPGHRRAVRVRPAHLHHQATRGQEQRRPPRVGGRRDQDLPGRQPRADRIVHHSRRPGHGPRRGGCPDQVPIDRFGGQRRFGFGAVREQHSRHVPPTQLAFVRFAALSHQLPVIRTGEHLGNLLVIEEEHVVCLCQPPRRGKFAADGQQMPSGVRDRQHQAVFRQFAQPGELAHPVHRESGYPSAQRALAAQSGHDLGGHPFRFLRPA